MDGWEAMPGSCLYMTPLQECAIQGHSCQKEGHRQGRTNRVTQDKTLQCMFCRNRLPRGGAQAGRQMNAFSPCVTMFCPSRPLTGGNAEICLVCGELGCGRTNMSDSRTHTVPDCCLASNNDQ
eukprot:1153343-Pelagomonas_calceolata.AAC.11